MHPKAPCLEPTLSLLLADYQGKGPLGLKPDLPALPDREAILSLLPPLLQLMYPGYFFRQGSHTSLSPSVLSVQLQLLYEQLSEQIFLVKTYLADLSGQEKLRRVQAQELAQEFLSRLPLVRSCLAEDLSAALDGDPAAVCFDEIILAYPGLYAITISRLAHELFLLDIPLIPRILTEYAHSVTGIDIHPGASIGHFFFIDHGTGIVIGETTIIGDHVKLYQGVTLGALSTRGGRLLCGKKRHPTIEDEVTIYAGASILGGETVIGRESVIGSNAFLTRSVPPRTRVSIRQQELTFTHTVPEGPENWFYII